MERFRFDIDRLSIPVFFALVTGALVLTAIAGGPLSWDGAHYLLKVLDLRVWFLPASRLINVPLQSPTLLVSRFTSNLEVLRLVFCLSYASVPLIGLLASYLVCRNRRSLFIWPALGIALGLLPGLFCFANEAIMMPSLFWPVLMAVLIGAGGVELYLVILLALAMLVSHLDAAAFFGFGTIAAIVSAWRTPRSQRRRYGAAIGLGWLCFLRLAIPLNPYEKHMLVFASLRTSFWLAINGWPLCFLILVALAACLCLLPNNRKRDLLVAAVVVVAGLMLIPWAIDPHAWWKELDFRFWSTQISLVLMTACALDAWRNADQATPARIRSLTLVAISVVFLAVLSVQCVAWRRITDRLSAETVRGGCIARASLTWTDKTPFDHWATADYAIVIQGRSPYTLVLDVRGVRAIRRAPNLSHPGPEDGQR